MKLALLFLYLITHATTQFIGNASCIEYSTIGKEVVDSNVLSEGFEDLHIKEFGNIVRFQSNTSVDIEQMEVIFSVHATASQWPSYSNESWSHFITIKLYSALQLNQTYVPGSLLVQNIVNVSLPWRPEADPNCTEGRWLDNDGICRYGLAFRVVFSFGHIPVYLPSELIYGITYDTKTAGFFPLNVSGPYDYLKLGLTSNTTSHGSEVVPGSTFLKSSEATAYADNGTAGVDVFRLDTGLGQYVPLVRFVNTSCSEHTPSTTDPHIPPDDSSPKRLSGVEQFVISSFSSTAGALFAFLIFRRYV